MDLMSLNEGVENMDENFDFQNPIIYGVIIYVITRLYLMPCHLGSGIKNKHISGC